MLQAIARFESQLRVVKEELSTQIKSEKKGLESIMEARFGTMDLRFDAEKGAVQILEQHLNDLERKIDVLEEQKPALEPAELSPEDFAQLEAKVVEKLDLKISEPIFQVNARLDNLDGVTVKIEASISNKFLTKKRSKRSS